MKNSKMILWLFVLVIFSPVAEARTWEKVDIPGALCGNGQPYSVYIDRKDIDKLFIEFMGGGACWDESSCYGIFPLTSLKPIPGAPTSTLMKEAPTSPWSRHSALYLPYCTGDVHVGTHVAQYRKDILLHHNGYTNILLALEFLHQQNIFDFQSLSDVTIWGASAGAIGALAHSSNIDRYLSPFARKTLISDSPGLHFGKSFWQKFSKDMNFDFQTNFGHIGLNVDLADGFLAPRMGPVFGRLSLWSIGILQSTKDTTMSLIFGDIFPEAHRNLVLGPQGIIAVGSRYPNVKTWVGENSQHTFLLEDGSAAMKSIQKETALNFASRVYRSRVILP